MLEALVHTLAGLSLALWASVIYTLRGRDPRAVLAVTAVLVALTLIGAGWLPHPAAGMLLGFFGMRAFHRWRGQWPALLAGLVAAVLFMLLGAWWLIFPLVVMAFAWMVTLMFATLDGSREREEASGEGGPAALPEQAGGFPFGTRKEPEAVPVGQAAASLPKNTAQPRSPLDDPFTALQLEQRLPGEARAQLVALDLRTKEALSHLEKQGQTGSQAAYSVRAIRAEYAQASVQAYLNLPRTRADTAPIDGGKTGKDLLIEQLDMLLNAVQDILDGTLKAGGQELLTQQRFLEERFGKKKSDLEV